MIDPTLHSAALAGAQATLNRLLALDSAAAARLRPLEGEVFHLQATDLGLSLYLIPGAGELRLAGYWDGPVTTTLRGDSTEFLSLLRASDPAATLVNSGLALEGASGALIQLQTALSALDPDWEAPLATLLGDLPAHALGRGLRRSWRWLEGARRSLARQATEYWREESEHLIPREEWEAFSAEAAACESALERLRERLRRLEAGRRRGERR